MQSVLCYVSERKAKIKVEKQTLWSEKTQRCSLKAKHMQKFWHFLAKGKTNLKFNKTVMLLAIH